MFYLNSKFYLIFLFLIVGCSGGSDESNIETEPTLLGAVSSDCNTDTDGDGLTDCFEKSTSLTLPNLADTDGDGRNDGYEWERHDPTSSITVFNPRIADMPIVEITLNSMPRIELDYSSTTGITETVSTNFTESSSNSITNGKSNGISSQVASSITHTAGATVGAEYNFSPTGGVTVSGELSYNFSSQTSESSGSQVNWNESASHAKSTAYSESLDLSKNESFTFTGANLTNVSVSIYNPGHVSYKLSELFLTVQSVDVFQPKLIETIGALQSTGLVTDVVGGGSVGPYSFSLQQPITLGVASRLLRSPDKLVIKPASFVLQDIDGNSILLRNNDVNALTAKIVLDFGENIGRPKEFQVAVKQPDGRNSMSVLDALSNILGLEVTQGITQWNYPDIGSSDTKFGMIGINGVSLDENNNAFWQIAHHFQPASSLADKQTDIFNIVLDEHDLSQRQLFPGDTLVLAYVSDQDRDGINDRTEKELGTDFQNKDTDGDGLDDTQELGGWETDLGDGDPDDCKDGKLVTVYSDPLNADSDNDGMGDLEEFENCFNPAGHFVANAGEQQLVSSTNLVELDGSVNGGEALLMDYRWSLISGQSVQAVDGSFTSNFNGKRPQFFAPNSVDTLVFELEVEDIDSGIIDRDIVQINVLADASRAVFVGPAGDGPVTGSMEFPYTSIAEALTTQNDVYVMSQESPYVLIDNLSIDGNISIGSLYGGYDINWRRNVDTNKTNVTYMHRNGLENPLFKIEPGGDAHSITVSGFNFNRLRDADTAYVDGVGENDLVGISIDATQGGSVVFTDNSVTVDSVGVNSELYPGSVYAIHAVGLNNLTIERNELIVGGAGSAVQGVRFARLSRAPNGGNGNSGSLSGVGAGGRNDSNGGFSGGAGGSGGNSDGRLGQRQADNGDHGRFNNVANGCGRSGLGGNEFLIVPGENGQSGCSQAQGSGGTPALLNNDLGLLEEIFMPFIAGDGTDGSQGGGGGGGGGGNADALFSWGGGGGAGGAGGLGGELGSGGLSGGASIGIWLYQIDYFRFFDNSVSSLDGGQGALGNFGQLGQQGGSGGSGGAGHSTIVGVDGGNGGNGGNGGSGADGGHGGQGGGGAGGPSLGLVMYRVNNTISFEDNIISSGNGGNGGDGGQTTGGIGGRSLAIWSDSGLTPDATNTLVNGEPGISGAAQNCAASGSGVHSCQ